MAKRSEELIFAIARRLQVCFRLLALGNVIVNTHHLNVGTVLIDNGLGMSSQPTELIVGAVNPKF